ncbi:hypothetical protein VB734_03395 [Synechococcus sp. BA-124 BA4]|uniref:hypothetical protein n=1 Tax=unclassified Synechococcus TaxID=2626047 RepID=UPI0018CCBCCC|nr:MULTISPECIES: hypothetical protein [unclassified Synechococcus]MEA5399082.1 hypothetical protein [Synechococcus sp. BA-124 BA4]QPN56940.1 hypothetical protein I1E95_01800 [Synechococcus sp. CBW1107]CAK6695199.1 hypothetical protein BBFGKLBO_01797 [Synechococcus sp. CBW1107]
MNALRRWLRAAMLAAALLLFALTAGSGPAHAGPVNWQEVPESPAGRQWWDKGSLRLSRDGELSVLTRFQPASEDRGQLYVMELDCGQKLYRDTSVNGLPRFKAEWQPTGGDDLISAVLDQACSAGSDLLASR